MLDVKAHVGMEGGGVAYWAHSGGFIFGAILAPLLGLFSNKLENKSLEV
jgi:membrane associated rhomboid family serine protease